MTVPSAMHSDWRNGRNKNSLLFSAKNSLWNGLDTTKILISHHFPRSAKIIFKGGVRDLSFFDTLRMSGNTVILKEISHKVKKFLDFSCVNRYIITMRSKKNALLPVSVFAAAVVLLAGVLVIITNRRETGF